MFYAQCVSVNCELSDRVVPAPRRSSVGDFQGARGTIADVQPVGTARVLVGQYEAVDIVPATPYSTVTDFARFRGLSTSVPFCTAT